MPREQSLPDTTLLETLWHEAKAKLRAQLEQRNPEAVFLEGSIAEGFGNDRSDVDFVALVDDGTKVATMPYILFLRERRVEVRLLSRERLERELLHVRAELASGLTAPSSTITWNELERCQRFMHCRPIHNPAYVRALQTTLGTAALEEVVVAWFADFARQAGRYAVAMQTLAQPDAARAWLKTAVFHAAKSWVARRGEHYLGSKWLALQIERAEMDDTRRQRLREILESRGADDLVEHVRRCLQLMEELEVPGVIADGRQVVFEPRAGITTWQIGQHVHVVRDQDVFRLGPKAARAWRAITFGTPCVDLANTGDASTTTALFAEFARAGLVSLCWQSDGPIRFREVGESRPASAHRGAILGRDGARWLAGDPELKLLPMPARRFAEAGVNLTWGNIGVENSLEDSIGALRKQQFGVLEYTLQRLVQAAALVALAAHGITPQPPLEEATLVAKRCLELDPDLVQRIECVEATPIRSSDEGKAQLELAREVVASLRELSGEIVFPESFEDDQGWCDTILYGYDWFNLAAHLDAPFPASAAGGRGTAEEARDLLASNLS